MKLTRVRVAELRQFREPFELAGLSPGLNIFCGNNEAGKSTLVRAIRAAFFERHRSTSVDDLRPYGDSAAAPQVELDFEIGQTPYRLRKQFLQKKRCELVAGSRRLEGAEAEDHLAEQLGFEFAAKGASRESLWGIPGLLWIEQGSGQELHGAVDHASSHLHQALDGLVGEVASTTGDEVLAQVRRLRDELLTPGSGKPRAAFQKALDQAQSARAEAQALEITRRQYQRQVDDLAALRLAHQADTEARPWLAWRAQQQTAREAWQAAQTAMAERAREQDKLRQASGLRSLIEQRLAAAVQQREELARREAVLRASVDQRAAAQSAHRSALEAERSAAALRDTAQRAVDAARLADTRQRLRQQQLDAARRLAELDDRLTQAEAMADRARLASHEAAAARLEPRDLQRLRSQRDRLHALEIRQAAVATRLHFAWQTGTEARLDGVVLPREGDRLLTGEACLEIEGVGMLQIVPGSADLAELAQQATALRSEHQALLQRLGLRDVAEAESRDLAARQRQADADAQAKALSLVAPGGLEVLRAEQATARARRDEALAAQGRLPPPPPLSAHELPLLEGVQALSPASAMAAGEPPDGAAGPPPPADNLALAESRLAILQEAATRAGTLLQQASEALAVAIGRVDSACLERDALLAAVESPGQRAELEQRQAELGQAIAQEAALRAALQALDERIQAVRPDILQQDMERYARSADEAERAHLARERQLLQLEATLEAQGAQGLDELWATAQSAAAAADARVTELTRRAQALDYLLQRLELRRQAVTQRLQAPLQQRMDHYLALLLPQARFEIGEDLRPQTLTRPSAQGPTAGSFDSLSFGAREQLGVIARLAYADLLQAAGRPTLLILDDALVHSDEHRLSQMKRVLFDAATRHQVLLFTCHPERWRDMGVPLRSLVRG